jgi:hypothetical protein
MYESNEFLDLDSSPFDYTQFCNVTSQADRPTEPTPNDVILSRQFNTDLTQSEFGTLDFMFSELKAPDTHQLCQMQNATHAKQQDSPTSSSLTEREGNYYCKFVITRQYFKW